MIKKDAIIIGSGQSASPLAKKLTDTGWKTLIIEKTEDMLGGTCLNVGCTPTKTLIGSAKVVHAVNTAKKHGISISGMDINFNKVQQRKIDIVQDGRKGIKKRTAKNKKLELIYGIAQFSSEKSVVVNLNEGGKEEFTAPYIFIDAGTRPAIADIPGLNKVKYYDSTGILELEEVPEKLIIIGGGYIGLELGQMYSRFDSNVTIIEHSEQIMSKEDQDIAGSVQEILETEGLKFILNADVEKVSSKKEKISVTYNIDGKKNTISGTHLLLVTGRKSNADGLNLKAAGIKTDQKGFIKVNSKLETNIKGVYALGDINGGPQFTHIAHNDFVIVSKNILEKANLSTKGRIVPYTIFTDPQIGRVGLSENQAKEAGLDYKLIKIPGRRITRGIEMAETQGLWKAIVDRKTDKILGASIVCTEGGEVATVIQMAMLGDIKASYFKDAIFSHPTYSESVKTLFAQLDK